jgi:hypothetical protein
MPLLGVKLTGYRLLNMTTVFSFGIIKAILTYNGPIDCTYNIGLGLRRAAGGRVSPCQTCPSAQRYSLSF